MKILITGGAGFIGSHTADALIARGHRVRILDNLQPTVHPHGKPAYLNPRAEFQHGDVRDKRAWQDALKGIEVVYHLAAYQDYLTDFSTFFHVNTVSTALLYEIIQAQALPVKKVIVAASQAVMGEGKYKCPRCFDQRSAYVFPEIRLEAQLSAGRWEHCCPSCQGTLQWVPSDELVIKPCNQYALSKHAQEQIAIQLGKRYDIPSVVMRYSIVQGPRQSFYNAYSGVMRIFALALFLGRPPLVFEDGRQVRDFVNIQDVVDANLVVLENDAADYQVFNVGGGRAWSVLEFYDTLQMVVDRQLAPHVAGYYRYGDTRHICSATDKLQALGWQPTRDIRQSIAAYWEYLQGQQAKDGILEYAEKTMKNQNVIRKVTSRP